MTLAQLYQTLKEQAEGQMPEVWFDLQKGQLQKASEHYPLPTPALLVKFGQMRYESIGGRRQMCKLDLSLYYYTWLGDTFDGSEAEAESLEILDAGALVHRCFGGFAKGFAPLERVAQQIEDWRGAYMVLRVDYQTAFKDTPANETTTPSAPELNLTIH